MPSREGFHGLFNQLLVGHSNDVDTKLFPNSALIIFQIHEVCIIPLVNPVATFSRFLDPVDDLGCSCSGPPQERLGSEGHRNEEQPPGCKYSPHILVPTLCQICEFLGTFIPNPALAMMSRAPRENHVLILTIAEFDPEAWTSGFVAVSDLPTRYQEVDIRL